MSGPPAAVDAVDPIDAASVDSNHLGRDNHIRNVDYLNVEAHREITFTSTDVQMLTPTTGILTGDLDMLGVTAPVSLDFEMVNRRNYPCLLYTSPSPRDS